MLDPNLKLKTLRWITKFRRRVPTWASLRIIGNSRPVQASAIFPIVGYLILLSNDVTSFFDGGLVETSKEKFNFWDRLWAVKLYFVYFGLLNLGLGSAVYQWRCPRQIKKHGDWEDYVRTDGSAMPSSYLSTLTTVLVKHYKMKEMEGTSFPSPRSSKIHSSQSILCSPLI